ncbi:AtpZ/AtpI family protein [Desulfofalx alkaliphila]|uniref:AtpZ/AtpI family protein n=1 Tax=Desulfofalx alkaliphila TaxID=105483 RepID=UPI000690088C|nr:AtpZ/AtpI family protein [Desulfofalx alkaliphila]
MNITKTHNKNGNGKNALLHAVGVTTTIGVEMAVTTTVGFYAGKYLDNRFDTEPIFLILGILLGLGIGVMGIVKTLEVFFKNGNNSK